jgi:hypothetical protein
LDPSPPVEAHVIVNGEPVEGLDPLFIGSLEDARIFVQELTPEERGEGSIFTPGRIYRHDEL